jgi:hypothetical protein
LKQFKKDLDDLIAFYEQEAFEAARKIKKNEYYLKPITYNIDGSVCYMLKVNSEYQTLKDWKEAIK